MSAARLLKPFFQKYYPAVLAGFFALVICDLAQLAIPTILGRAIDMISGESGQQPNLLRPVIQILLLAALVAVARFAWRNLILGFARRVEKGLREKLYERMIHLSPRWHLENDSGDIMAMATNDMDSIRQAIAAGLISVIDTLVMGCVALGFMLAISPSMTLWALLPMPAISLATHFLGRRIYRMVLEVQDIFGLLTETVREQLSGLRAIRAMGLINLSLAETEKSGRVYLEKNVQMSFLSGLFFPFLHFMSNLAVTLVLYFGGRETILAQISTGDFVAFITYLAMLTWPLMALGMIVGFIQQGLASLNRINRVLSAVDEAEPVQAAEEKAADWAEDLAPVLEARNLSFCYPGRNMAALKGLNLRLDPSELTALVGPMGSGKSTLAAVLQGLYRCPPETVWLNDIPLEQWPSSRLRSIFGYVPQDGFLFSGTVFDNIAFGRPEASESELLEAADIAGLTADIQAWPEGLQTVVGERGVSLSGGQRQRLALARALLLDPPYLIMDDTLSAVDAAVEDEILRRLRQQRRGRGALIISHRLTSLMDVHRVLVMQDGRIVDDGSPAELLSRDGYFKRVCELATKRGAVHER